MEFINETPFPTELSSGSTSENEMLGIIVCKVTFAVDGGRLIPLAADQGWPVFTKPFVYEDVTFSTDMDHLKEGTDILVFGKARAPRGRPVQKLRVAVSSDRVLWQADVHGDRRWQRRGDGLVATAANPFTELPLTNDLAYGGKAMMNGEELPHHINPDGRGFYLEKEDAEDRPLANIESVDAPISNWNDIVTPTCLYKPQGPLGLPVLEHNDDDPLKVVLPMLEQSPNQTVPELTVDARRLAETIRLTGFAESGDLEFPTPPREGPTAYAAVGEKTGRFVSELTTIVLLADEQVVIATYRCLFRYLFEPLQKRRTRLVWDHQYAASLISERVAGHA